MVIVFAVVFIVFGLWLFHCTGGSNYSSSSGYTSAHRYSHSSSSSEDTQTVRNIRGIRNLSAYESDGAPDSLKEKIRHELAVSMAISGTYLSGDVVSVSIDEMEKDYYENPYATQKNITAGS